MTNKKTRINSSVTVVVSDRGVVLVSPDTGESFAMTHDAAMFAAQFIQNPGVNPETGEEAEIDVHNGQEPDWASLAAEIVLRKKFKPHLGETRAQPLVSIHKYSLN